MKRILRLIRHAWKRKGLMALAAMSLVLGGCSSGSTVTPPPVDNGGFTLMSCGVQEINSEMHVLWVADEPTSGEIRFGQNMFTQLIRVSTVTDSHDIVLTGLNFSTNYVYQVRIFDRDLNSAECEGQFRTPQKATPEPVISGFAISEITETSARLTWRTDEPATTILYYGIGETADSVVTTALVFQHDVRLDFLTPSTLYEVRPEAVDSTNLRGVGRDSSFATASRLTLWFDGAHIGLGDTATVRVHLENATDIAALQYTLAFETGILEVVDVIEGAFYNNNGGFAFFRGIRNSRGEVANHMAWSIQYDGDERIGTNADGSGIVAELRVRGVSPGNADAGFQADSSFGLDMFAHTRLCSLRVGEIVVLE